LGSHGGFCLTGRGITWVVAAAALPVPPEGEVAGWEMVEMAEDVMAEGEVGEQRLFSPWLNLHEDTSDAMGADELIALLIAEGPRKHVYDDEEQDEEEEQEEEEWEEEGEEEARTGDPLWWLQQAGSAGEEAKAAEEGTCMA
jgi:hypothetical protein